MVQRLYCRGGRLGVLALCVGGVVLAASSAGLAAASVNVPCAAGGPGLVTAVNTVNAAGGGSINLDSGCTYSLTTRNNVVMGGNGLPVVVSPITVNGKRRDDRGQRQQLPDLRDRRQLGRRARPERRHRHRRQDSRGDGRRGGRRDREFSGTLTLNSAVVTGNYASGAGGGIASAFGATTTLNKSEVSWNTVPDTGSGGGGMLSLASTLTLNRSTVDHNSGPGGGGIASGNGQGGGPGSTVTLNQSVIAYNTAAGAPDSGGGGISNGGTLISNNSEIINNSAPRSWGRPASTTSPRR